MRRAPAIELTDDERATLTKWSRGKTTPARLLTRARIVLLAADGRLSKDISAELGVPQKTISQWRTRFATERLAGIEQDAPRGGRTPSVRQSKEAEIITLTTQHTPPGATHWCCPAMKRARFRPWTARRRASPCFPAACRR